jgi:DNA-binding MarR family transcriptional regulator
MKNLRFNQHLTEEERRRFWAAAFSITGPEWMIILALADAKAFTISIQSISRMLKVDQSFVRSHGRGLERKGYVQCFVERDEIVSLSLSEAAEAKFHDPYPDETMASALTRD